VKRCCTCHEFKEFSHFNKRESAYDGLQSRCRECSREWYANNREEHMKNVKRRNDAERERIRMRVQEYLAGSRCVDCGVTDVRVLEFDHRPGTKKLDNVGSLVSSSYSWKAVAREIAKCDVRCANCHRIVTYERAGSWRHSAFLKSSEEGAERYSPFLF
jgi:hypothetical protein